MLNILVLIKINELYMCDICKSNNNLVGFIGKNKEKINKKSMCYLEMYVWYYTTCIKLKYILWKGIAENKIGAIVLIESQDIKETNR